MNQDRENLAPPRTVHKQAESKRTVQLPELGNTETPLRLPMTALEFNSPKKEHHVFSTASPKSSHVYKDQQRVIESQRKKLEEMRRNQLVFFDTRMIELNAKHARMERREIELHELEASLQERENWVRDQLMRIEIEKCEISSIRDLMKAEGDAMQLTAKDMKAQIQKYDRMLRVRFTEKPS